MADPKQYFFVSHRDITITSTLGYSLAFEKGKPMHVPRAMHPEVMEKGIMPCDAKGNALDAPEAAAISPDAPKVLVSPEDPEERKDAIKTVLQALVDRNDPHDFSASGIPSSGAVTAALGWKVEPKEIRPIWQEMKPGIVKASGEGK